MKYNATIAFDVPCYANVEIEAGSDAEALELAKKLASEAAVDYEAAWDHADDHRVVVVTREEDDEVVPGSQSVAV
jgi:hypothetical protein